eukprot:COSAG02_NODE_3404_length_6797_cov_54.443267_8_plen_201_part_00
MWGVGCGVWGVGCGVWGVGCGAWGVGCGVWGVGRGAQTLRGVGCDHTETSIASALTLTHPMYHDHTTSNRHDAHNHRLGRSNPASLHLKNVKGARPPLPRCPGPSLIFGFSFLDAGWGWWPRSMVAEMPRGPAPKPPCANNFSACKSVLAAIRKICGDIVVCLRKAAATRNATAKICGDLPYIFRRTNCCHRCHKIYYNY